MFRKAKRVRRGFTLIELMLVLVILGVLAGVVVPKLIGSAEKSKVTAAQSGVHVLNGVIQTFYMHCKRFPTSEEGLNALVTKPADADGWAGPYIEPNNLKDPWDQQYHYVYPGTHNPDGFDVYSSGPDKQDGTGDDIGNWTK